MGLQFGTVGEWIAGAAAAAGLFFTGLEIRASKVERKLEEERRRADELNRRMAMARAVGVQAIPSCDARGRWSVRYQVHNAGDYPIDNVVLVVGDPGAETMSLADQVGTVIEVVLGTVLPNQSVEDTVDLNFTREPAFGDLTRLSGLLFTDTWNQPWFRGPGVLEKQPSSPRVC